MTDFKNAIVRKPGKDFFQGLTTANLGSPDEKKTSAQHDAYCQALIKCGLSLTVLEELPGFPDSTFVEDTAVLNSQFAILTNPGAESRKGEVQLIKPALKPFFNQFYSITPPGTLEGGDICEAGSHFFIGISHRTNEEGARQLSEFLKTIGITSSTVDIRKIPGILHLKSGIAYLGDKTLIVIDSLKDHPAFRDWKIIPVDAEENYAANCVRINEIVLIASGYPKLKNRLEKAGYLTLELEMTEFQKMDGGLSCLSLRF